MDLRLRRLGLCAVTGLVTVAFVLSLPLVAALMMGWLQTIGPIDEARLTSVLADGRPTAIVILSAGRRSFAPEFGGETVDALTLERCRYGARLAWRTGLPVLTTGGGDDETPLARLMAQALKSDYAIDVRWQEERSRTTAENAILSAAMLREAGISRIVLVTHAWHMRRAVAAFEGNGVEVMPAPTAYYDPPSAAWWDGLVPTMAAFRMSGYAIHESVGYLWYEIKYGYR